MAFLAMAQYRLGHKEQAQANLNRLREMLVKPKYARDKEAQGFLRETEMLLKGKPENPKQ